MPDKDLIVFDLDGTLAPSKSLLDSEMAQLLEKLLVVKKVAVVSGGRFEQFQKQFLSSLSSSSHFQNLLLLPTTGTCMYIWDGGWQKKYSEDLTEEEKIKITKALEQIIESPLYDKPQEVQGDLVEDRGTQITFSGVGQQAPISLKQSWDPSHAKRDAMVAQLRTLLPEFDINIGGMTSIDITRAGITKEYAMHKLAEYTQLPFARMLFVGDALFPGGNDAPAKATGVECISVKDPEETKKLLESWYTKII